MYSFSQFEDASFGFWGAGRAGWFLIRPAESYRKVYAAMEEAVAMFYFLADHKSRPAGRGSSVSFKKTSNAEVQELCKEVRYVPSASAFVSLR